MTKNQFYIYKKEVDWSVLHEGFSIPVSIQVNFQKQIRQFLKRGESKFINLILGNETYIAKLINQIFDKNKYPKHKDIIQIRYPTNSNLSKKIREIFNSSYNYLKVKRTALSENEKRQIRTPMELKEFIVLYSTDIENIIFMDYITIDDSSEMKSYIANNKIMEEDFELPSKYNRVDLFAEIEKKYQIVKIRKLDRAIGENLKLLYNYCCQICGNNFGYKYDANIVESHHISPFVTSLNNDSENIIIVCPNHHRVIHKINPEFDNEKHIFLYPNGLEEKLKLNLHL